MCFGVTYEMYHPNTSMGHTLLHNLPAVLVSVDNHRERERKTSYIALKFQQVRWVLYNVVIRCKLIPE